MGHERHFGFVRHKSVLHLIADIMRRTVIGLTELVSAMGQSRPMLRVPPTHRSKRFLYSITLSARASSIGGTVRPSALAVLRLITNSYMVGACTGKSSAFSPFMMRSM